MHMLFPDMFAELESHGLLSVPTYSAKVTRPVVRYHGGKFGVKGSLARWIMSHFVSHDCYVEPYGGGASVLLMKSPSAYEVYNDLDSEVVNFFKVLREQPERFLTQVKLTPWSREETTKAFERTDDPLESARRFFVRAWQTRHGQAQSNTGWRFQKSVNRQSVTRQWDNVDWLWSIVERLKLVQIEHDDALKVFKRFDSLDTLFYVDPPYLPETRGRWAKTAYQHEMSIEDHQRLLSTVRNLKGYVLLSGYSTDLYHAALSDWECVSREFQTDGSKRVEHLWLSPSITKNKQQMNLLELLTDA